MVTMVAMVVGVLVSGLPAAAAAAGGLDAVRRPWPSLWERAALPRERLEPLSLEPTASSGSDLESDHEEEELELDSPEPESDATTTTDGLLDPWSTSPDSDLASPDLDTGREGTLEPDLEPVLDPVLDSALDTVACWGWGISSLDMEPAVTSSYTVKKK